MGTKQFENILDDFSLEQRTEYAAHIAPHTLASLADQEGDEFVYYDLYDWCLK
jgi:hypothetical protein